VPPLQFCYYFTACAASLQILLPLHRFLPFHQLLCHFTACAATSSLLLLHRLRRQFNDFAATSPFSAISPTFLPLHRICCNFASCAATSPPVLPLHRLSCSFTDSYVISPHLLPIHRPNCGSILASQFTNDYRRGSEVIP